MPVPFLEKWIFWDGSYTLDGKFNGSLPEPAGGPNRPDKIQWDQANEYVVSYFRPTYIRVPATSHISVRLKEASAKEFDALKDWIGFVIRLKRPSMINSLMLRIYRNHAQATWKLCDKCGHSSQVLPGDEPANLVYQEVLTRREIDKLPTVTYQGDKPVLPQVAKPNRAKPSHLVACAHGSPYEASVWVSNEMTRFDEAKKYKSFKKIEEYKRKEEWEKKTPPVQALPIADLSIPLAFGKTVDDQFRPTPKELVAKLQELRKTEEFKDKAILKVSDFPDLAGRNLVSVALVKLDDPTAKYMTRIAMSHAFLATVAHHQGTGHRIYSLVKVALREYLRYDLKVKLEKLGVSLAAAGVVVALTLATGGVALGVLAGIAAAGITVKMLLDAWDGHEKSLTLRQYYEQRSLLPGHVQKDGKTIERAEILGEDAAVAIRKSVDHLRKAMRILDEMAEAEGEKVDFLERKGAKVDDWLKEDFETCDDMVGYSMKAFKFMHELDKFRMYLLPCLAMCHELLGNFEQLMETWAEIYDAYEKGMAAFIKEGDHRNCYAASLSRCYHAGAVRAGEKGVNVNQPPGLNVKLDFNFDTLPGMEDNETLATLLSARGLINDEIAAAYKEMYAKETTIVDRVEDTFAKASLQEVNVGWLRSAVHGWLASVIGRIDETKATKTMPAEQPRDIVINQKVDRPRWDSDDAAQKRFDFLKKQLADRYDNPSVGRRIRHKFAHYSNQKSKGEKFCDALGVGLDLGVGVFGGFYLAEHLKTIQADQIGGWIAEKVVSGSESVAPTLLNGPALILTTNQAVRARRLFDVGGDPNQVMQVRLQTAAQEILHRPDTKTSLKSAAIATDLLFKKVVEHYLEAMEWLVGIGKSKERIIPDKLELGTCDDVHATLTAFYEFHHQVDKMERYLVAALTLCARLVGFSEVLAGAEQKMGYMLAGKVKKQITKPDGEHGKCRTTPEILQDFTGKEMCYGPRNPVRPEAPYIDLDS